MRWIGWLFGLSLVLLLWPTGSAGEPLSGQVVLEQPGNAHPGNSLPPVWNVWAEGPELRRKPRPYRNPLRRLRKQMRWAARQRRRAARRALRAGRRQVTAEATPPPAAVEPVARLEAPEATGAPIPPEPAPAAGKRGRQPVVPTDHVFCPNEGCQGYNQLGPHPNHRIVGAGIYTTSWGEERQLFQCQWCKRRFSETRGTVFFGLKTSQETVYRTLACLAEGQSLRATARIFEVEVDTVLLWLKRAGQHCEKVSFYLMRNLRVEQAQLDELWTFVHKKEKSLSAWEKLHSEWGDTWVWTALDPAHKLVLAFWVGEHEEAQAVSVLQRLKAVLAEGCLPLLTSDQLPHYVEAILKVLGRWVRPERNGSRGRFPKPRLQPPEGLQYGTVHKERQGGRVVSVTTQVVFGKAKELQARLKALGVQKINTSFVERMNLTLRHLVSRLRRRGLTFSKKRQYLEWHLHLGIAYYHFVRPHRSLRLRLPQPIPTKGDGTPKKWEKRTPALSAGLTDHIWTMQELLAFRVPQVSAACA